ncbi:MAG: tyrosine-protein phosphatase, partial [Bacilli bacterium]|nr:tyrosine-protein phosphatase [Bacilli bacterium]
MKRISFENIENFRDLGGYESRFGYTEFGVIYRSATLAYASKRDVKKLLQLGIKTVIDLREDSVKRALPCPLLGKKGVKVIELPVNGNGRIPTTPEDQVDSYMEMLDDRKTAREIVRAFLTADKPLVFHCNAGKDRTGCFAMLLLALAGVDFQDINLDHLASYPYLPKMTKDTRANRPDVPELMLVPDLDFLGKVYGRFLEQYKSPEKYLRYLGFDKDAIRLAQNLLGKQEKSCGSLLFHNGMVLIEHMKLGHYSIPKGHVEPCDLDDHATARREIKEELGIEEVRFIKGFEARIRYAPKPGAQKEVVFFLAET